VYHLFYADEEGDAGSDITFFEYPGVPRGRAGDGMVHRIVYRVPSADAFDFWDKRLGSAGVPTYPSKDHLRFSDPEGLDFELRVDTSGDPPLRAIHPEIPEDVALLGFEGVHAYNGDQKLSAGFLEEVLEFEPDGSSRWTARGERRGSFYAYDEPPGKQGLSGGGTIHHVAWGCPIDEHEAWHDRVKSSGADVTPIIDRYYFKSIYFREPSGVLFEIATLGPGFAVDEPIEHLGESIALPPNYEHLRDRLEGVLTPLPNPRAEALSRRK
jgi:glyoxalase family protein